MPTGLVLTLDANCDPQNGWEGADTPLDVQGFDYSTQNYDDWHAKNPNTPSISSETSSAVSDRGETTSDAKTGHVTGYDSDYPGWGQSAEMAWGGVNEKAQNGILTRPFISGGWTWTGWDYRGEPTPYAWPVPLLIDIDRGVAVAVHCAAVHSPELWN